VGSSYSFRSEEITLMEFILGAIFGVLAPRIDDFIDWTIKKVKERNE